MNKGDIKMQDRRLYGFGIAMGMTLIAMMVTPDPALSFVGFQTGNTLLATCTSDNIGVCLGYLEGLADVMALGSPVYKSHACLPSGVSGRQLIDITVDFLQSHAAIRHFQAASLVAAAFANSFPCSGKIK